MAYDSKDDRSNNPAEVLKRAGITTREENDGGQGWLQSTDRKQVGPSVNPSNKPGWGEDGKLRK